MQQSYIRKRLQIDNVEGLSIQLDCVLAFYHKDQYQSAVLGRGIHPIAIEEGSVQDPRLRKTKETLNWLLETKNNLLTWSIKNWPSKLQNPIITKQFKG